MVGGIGGVGSVVLAAAAAAATLAAGLGVVGYVLTRGPSLHLVLTVLYGRRLLRARAPSVHRHEVVRAVWDAVGCRVRGEERTAAQELELLAALVGLDALPGIPMWHASDTVADRRVRAYESILVALKRSLILRLAGSADICGREVDLAERVLAVLLDDADHLPEQVDGRGDLGASTRRPKEKPPKRLIEDILHQDLGTSLLVPPPRTLAASFRGFRVALTKDHYGPEPKPFDVVVERLSAGGRTGWCWTEETSAKCTHALCEQLDARALTVASGARDRGWFNGRVLRVRAWAPERSQTSSPRRIALLADETSFLTALTTSEGLDSCPPGLRREIRERCLDRSNGLMSGKTPQTGNLLGVHITVVTADRRILIVRRGRGAWLDEELLTTAANGAVEIGDRLGLGGGDLDADGFVDVLGGALRETREELGDLRLDRENSVVRALALTLYPRPDAPTHISPWAAVEVRTPLAFHEIPTTQFVTASRHEGAHEVGAEFVGLSVRSADLHGSVRWLRERFDAGDIRPGGVVTSALALVHFMRADDFARAWDDGTPGPEAVTFAEDPSAAVVRIRVS